MNDFEKELHIGNTLSFQDPLLIPGILPIYWKLKNQSTMSIKSLFLIFIPSIFPSSAKVGYTIITCNSFLQSLSIVTLLSERIIYLGSSIPTVSWARPWEVAFRGRDTT